MSASYYNWRWFRRTHRAETLPVRIKPILMRLPWPVWKRLVYPVWLRWYRWRMDATWLWKSGPYDPGDVVYWRGVKLICCHDHYCGSQADHPWDPGHFWPDWKQAAMWEPARPWDRFLLRLVGDPRGVPEQGNASG